MYEKIANLYPSMFHYILDKKVKDHEFQPKFSCQIWHDNDFFFYFYISEDSFGHHLS